MYIMCMSVYIYVHHVRCDFVAHSVECQLCKGYGQFSNFHVCFCGLDPGNLKFETVRTNQQHICF